MKQLSSFFPAKNASSPEVSLNLSRVIRFRAIAILVPALFGWLSASTRIARLAQDDGTVVQVVQRQDQQGNRSVEVIEAALAARDGRSDEFGISALRTDPTLAAI